MTATLAPPVANRIANYLTPAPLPVPATPAGKQAAWADALFAAAMFYQSRLADPDPEVAERAARALFDLEKTRLRHGRDLAGANAETPEQEDDLLPPVADLPPLESRRTAKACERTMAAAAAEPPAKRATFEEMTDAELVDHYEATRPAQFQVWADLCRKRAVELGRTPTAAEVRAATKRFLTKQMRTHRAECEKKASKPSP